MHAKRYLYIFLFMVLGFLLQFVVHAGIETWYISLLLRDFSRFGFGWTWETWFFIHHAISVALALGGIMLGLRQGRYWWRRIYEKKK